MWVERGRRHGPAPQGPRHCEIQHSMGPRHPPTSPEEQLSPCSSPCPQTVLAVSKHSPLPTSSENGSGWKRPPSSWSPAVPPALPGPPQTHVPKHHMHRFLGHFRGGDYTTPLGSLLQMNHKNLHSPGLFHSPWVPPRPQKMPELCGAAG